MAKIHVPQIVTRQNCEDTGHSRYLLNTGRLSERAIHGAHESPAVMELVTVPDWADVSWVELFRRARALSAVRPETAFCSFSAAQLYGFPLPFSRQGGPLHVLVPEGYNRVRMANTIGHRSTRLRVQSHYDLRLNHPGYVLLELANFTSWWNLVQICDALMGEWHGPSMVSHSALTAFVTTQPRYRGKTRLVSAVSSARPGVDSPKETDTRLTIVRSGLPEPLVHPSIRLPSGRTVEPDLGYVEEKVVLEYEGEHHREAHQWGYDIERYDELRALGYEVIRIMDATPQQIWLPKLRRALARAH